MADTPTDKNKAPAPPVNPSPKQRFLQSKSLVSAHRSILDRPEFEVVCDYAMLHYQYLLSGKTVDAITASAAGFKLQGALEFLAVLRNLSETTPPIQRRIDDNLKQ